MNLPTNPSAWIVDSIKASLKASFEWFASHPIAAVISVFIPVIGLCVWINRIVATFVDAAMVKLIAANLPGSSDVSSLPAMIGPAIGQLGYMIPFGDAVAAFVAYWQFIGLMTAYRAIKSWIPTLS